MLPEFELEKSEAVSINKFKKVEVGAAGAQFKVGNSSRAAAGRRPGGDQGDNNGNAIANPYTKPRGRAKIIVANGDGYA